MMRDGLFYELGVRFPAAAASRQPARRTIRDPDQRGAGRLEGRSSLGVLANEVVDRMRLLGIEA